MSIATLSGLNEKQLGDLARVYAGGTPSRTVPSYWNGNIPWVTTAEIGESEIGSTSEYITDSGLRNSAAKVAPAGTLLMAMYGQGKTRGKTSKLAIASAMNQACAAIEPGPEIDPDFLMFYLQANYEYIRGLSNSGSQENLSGRIVKGVVVRYPDLQEQVRIARTLASASRLVMASQQRVSKKLAIKQGISEQLLTGRARLAGFGGDWRTVRLQELLTPRSERNLANAHLEVLSCTKSGGFVRSLDFFKNQVFSRNLSNYRVIRRGDIGYPANHIEEGSIGVQELYNTAVVSPIYVVLQPNPGVDTFFLHRLLKLESFRQEFARVTNASVNRRGSLRWPQFSQIRVAIPSPIEQNAIAEVIRSSEAEVSLTERDLQKARDIKTGMMQQLLFGRTRLVAGAAS